MSDYLGRARRAGLSRPLPNGLDDAGPKALLFPPLPDVPSDQRPMPDWTAIHRDLRRPNVTLALLWEEYRAATTDGFGYSWFCDLYRACAGRLKPTLRQVHVAGERLFVDFAGHTMEVIDAATAEVRRAELFVSVLGASSYTTPRRSLSQGLADLIGATAALRRPTVACRGAGRRDQLKSRVTEARPLRTAVTSGPTRRWPAHYGTVVLPARRPQPTDKAKVEVAVQVAQRWILARLRNQTFFSLDELNQRIWELLGATQRPGDEGLRRQPAAALRAARQAGAATPAARTRFVYGEWKRVRVNVDYHVEIEPALLLGAPRAGA